MEAGGCLWGGWGVAEMGGGAQAPAQRRQRGKLGEESPRRSLKVSTQIQISNSSIHSKTPTHPPTHLFQQASKQASKQLTLVYPISFISKGRKKNRSLFKLIFSTGSGAFPLLAEACTVSFCCCWWCWCWCWWC